jgi:hypothetical protein
MEKLPGAAASSNDVDLVVVASMHHAAALVDPIFGAPPHGVPAWPPPPAPRRPNWPPPRVPFVPRLRCHEDVRAPPNGVPARPPPPAPRRPNRPPTRVPSVPRLRRHEDAHTPPLRVSAPAVYPAAATRARNRPLRHDRRTLRGRRGGHATRGCRVGGRRWAWVPRRRAWGHLRHALFWPSEVVAAIPRRAGE